VQMVECTDTGPGMTPATVAELFRWSPPQGGGGKGGSG